MKVLSLQAGLFRLFGCIFSGKWGVRGVLAKVLTKITKVQRTQRGKGGGCCKLSELVTFTIR